MKHQWEYEGWVCEIELAPSGDRTIWGGQAKAWPVGVRRRVLHPEPHLVTPVTTTGGPRLLTTTGLVRRLRTQIEAKVEQHHQERVRLAAARDAVLDEAKAAFAEVFGG